VYNVLGSFHPEAMMSNTAEEMFEVKVPTPELSKGEREYQTFLRLLPASAAG
jgi:hypothetical protein